MSAAHSGFPSRTRVAAIADLDAIVRIEHASFVHAGERFGDRRVRYLIESPRVSVCVAELNEKVSGWICGFAVTRSPRPWGRIYALAVDPSARGNKIGPQLLTLGLIALLGLGMFYCLQANGFARSNEPRLNPAALNSQAQTASPTSRANAMRDLPV